jgi:hypothetical protein
MPPKQTKTPYAQEIEHYDKIQAIREPAYDLNKIFNKWENLKYVYVLSRFFLAIADTTFPGSRSRPRTSEC